MVTSIKLFFFVSFIAIFVLLRIISNKNTIFENRLLTTLLLLKNGYQWIEYVSFEHEIENKKSEYYRVLRSCQINRPNENITEWIYFYLNSLQFIQKQLLEKLNSKGVVSQLTQKEKSIVTFIELHSGCKSGEIAQK